MKLEFYFCMVYFALLITGCNGINSTSDINNTGSSPLSSIDPGRYDTTWWNRMPFRLIQTNLHETDAMMDEDKYVQAMVDASANVVLLNVGGIQANYPTKLPYEFRNPYLKGDLVGDLVKKLHEKGIKVVGRFDFSKINETLAAKKPEWLYVGTDGKNVNYNGQVHTCINGGYQQQYSLDILKEAITTYPLDGIFFNMMGYTTTDYSGVYHGICQCENCKKRFYDSTGYTLPIREDMNDPIFRKYTNFQKTTSEKLFTETGNYIKSLNPKLIIASYVEVGFVDMIVDETSLKSTSECEFNYAATENVKSVLGSYKDRSPFNLIMYAQGDGFRHIGIAPNLAKVWVLENMLQGAPLGFVFEGDMIDYEDRVFISTLNDLYGFHKSNGKLFTNLQAVSNVALIRGDRNEFEGMIKLLTEEHIMFDVMEPSVVGTKRTPRKLEDYDALILGDVRSMDNDLIAAINNYVKNGGKILATGFTSLDDRLGNSSNTIKLQSLGVMPPSEVFRKSKSTYLKVTENDKTALGEVAFKDFSLMIMYSDFLKCKARDSAHTFLKLVPSTRIGPPEKAYYTAENITDFPGIISNVYGKGKSVYIPWLIGSQYLDKGNYSHRTLFVSCLHNLLKVERSIQTDASPLIEITHQANRNGAFEWIGMINHSGQIGYSFRDPIVIHNTSIRFKPLKQIKEIKLMRTGGGLKFKQSNGWVEFIVPQVDDYEMVLCLYE